MHRRKLHILGHTYNVRPHQQLASDDGTPAQVNKRTQEIRYDPSFTSSNIQESIIHEMFEAINYHLEIGLEHKQITALSEAIFDTLKRNGWLAKNIMDGKPSNGSQ